VGSTTALKRRIGSVKNTRQITKAMELVAASKMKRAQDQAVAARAYRVAAHHLLKRLSNVSDVDKNRLFVVRPVKKNLILLITSDIGLAGAYDANVLKNLTNLLKEDVKNKVKTEVIAIGKKGAQFVSRLEGVDLLATFPVFTSQPKGADIRPIVKIILDKYSSEDVDAVNVVYTGFVSSIKQDVSNLQLLPSSTADQEGISELEVAIFEPSIESIVESAAARLIEVQVWQAILESLASEHSSRMLAMKNATDNANDIIDDLTLEFNTARQAAITQEIAEIVGGAEAVKAE
jgi:F-type H+-transporting ATPase subunit gamma